MIRPTSLARGSSAALLAAGIVTLFVASSAGTASACDPVTITAGPAVGDDPAGQHQARAELEAKIAALRAEIAALESLLAGTPASGERRVFRLGADGAPSLNLRDGSGVVELRADGGEPVLSLDGFDAVVRSRNLEGASTGAPSGALRLRSLSPVPGAGADAAAPAAEVRVFQLGGDAAAPSRVAPQGQKTGCCCCCCPGAGVSATAAPATPALRRWRVAEMAPAATTPTVAQPRTRTLFRAAPPAPPAPGVGHRAPRVRAIAIPGGAGETEVIIERSPGAPAAPCCGATTTPAPTTAPTPPAPFDPFGAAPPAVPGATASGLLEVRTVPVRLDRPAAAPFPPLESGAGIQLRRVGKSPEYY